LSNVFEQHFEIEGKETVRSQILQEGEHGAWFIRCFEVWARWGVGWTWPTSARYVEDSF
jgi:hypothetical protein